MKTVNVRYIAALNKVSIEHFNGERINYPLDIDKNELDISQATILLQELFQADIKRLTDEYNEAEAMLRALDDRSNRISKKTRWIFKKDLFIKALDHNNSYPQYQDPTYWVNLADGCEATLLEKAGHVTAPNGKTFFVLKEWCEEVE